MNRYRIYYFPSFRMEANAASSRRLNSAPASQHITVMPNAKASRRLQRFRPASVQNFLLLKHIRNIRLVAYENMEGLQVDKSESQNGSRILTLHGTLTLKTLFEFQELLRQDHPSHLIIDLSDVSYMDSAGLGAVLGGYASCERTGRGFGITGISERVNTLLQVAGVDKMVPRFESVEAAEKKFSTKAAKS